MSVPVTPAEDDARFGRSVAQGRAPKPPRRLSSTERRRLVEAKRRHAEAEKPPTVHVGETADGKPVLGLPHRDQAGWMALACEAFGTASTAFVAAETQRLAKALVPAYGRAPTDTEMNSALALIAGIAPRNEAEACLAIQMAAVHAGTMTLMASVARMSPHSSAYEMTARLANRFARTYATQIEALGKLRRTASTQVIRVERVLVAAENAVVGTINPAGQGGQIIHGGQCGGASDEGAGQPAQCTALRSEDQVRSALPAPGGEGEAALQNSWRGEGDWCATG